MKLIDGGTLNSIFYMAYGDIQTISGVQYLRLAGGWRSYNVIQENENTFQMSIAYEFYFKDFSDGLIYHSLESRPPTVSKDGSDLFTVTPPGDGQQGEMIYVEESEYLYTAFGYCIQTELTPG